MGLITNMRSQMQVVMWTILVLFIVSMAIGGLVGGASIGDIFGQNSSDNIGSLNGKPILHEDFNRLVFDEIGRIESQSGETMSDEDREYVRAVVWERLIQDLLIQEQIEENEIVIGDDEVLYQLWKQFLIQRVMNGFLLKNLCEIFIYQIINYNN